ncbi:thioredoxin family protein [Eikenella sp. S3360]|uniref:Thioredoxin family protein n=1 Tax=Eikenella glucosivorans TaxID=2766967 RepID=A0ABS0NCG3_9NEIS|nr:thioredoxin family protein [Eikenella glucosivorans]MBH5329934.1 thioredoxin family protein [Eikenella glucosivorans]
MKQLHTLKEIETAIAAHPLVSLYIKAPNCGVCTALAPQLEAALAQADGVYAVQANIADIPEMAAHFHALTAPVWLLFFHGKEVERMARFIPQADMAQALAKWARAARQASTSAESPPR